MDTDTYPPFTFDESPDSDTVVIDAPPPVEPPPAPPEAPAPRERRRPGYLAVAAVAAACALAGGVGGVYAGRELAPARTVTTIGNGDAAVPVQAAVPGSYVAVAAKVLPSVVSIDVTVNGGRGSGSGVVIRSDGYILTNNHVAGDATSLRVTFNDGTSATARLVGGDAASDLAVIKVDKTGLTAATLGRSANVKVGDNVLAVGSPLGLSGTVTAGIVSALNRPVNTTDRSTFGQSSVTTVIDAIQTDAAINPGNSGGALVDLAGQVIGINSAIATAGSTSGQAGNIGVGFAIPIDQAKSIATQLIETGHASRAQIGVSVGEATNADGTTRVVLQAVTAGGPADLAGLATGDTIIAIGDHQVTDADGLIAAVRAHAPGETVTVTYERGGSRHTASVKLTDAAAG
ncbi:MAG: putative serine protease PepD [Frankiaceae bacterium]|jgi:putative serine protease PepD|nr:putative serine protease PepD [Frankiaceae bacterium]